MRRGLTVFDTPFQCRGILICYDNNWSKTRATALLGRKFSWPPPDRRLPLAALTPWGVSARHGTTANAIRGPSGRVSGSKGRGWLRWPSRAHDNGMFVVFNSNGVGWYDEIHTGNP